MAHPGSSGQPQQPDPFAPPPRRIVACVLVGGASRMPAVRDLVRRLAGAPLLEGPGAEHAVALGAATHAGMLLGLVAGLESRDGAYSRELHGRASGFGGGADGAAGEDVAIAAGRAAP